MDDIVMQAGYTDLMLDDNNCERCGRPTEFNFEANGFLHPL